MSYVMNEVMYWQFINNEKFNMTHEEVISYINNNFGLRGKVTELHIVKI